MQTAPLGLGLEGGPSWEMRQPYAVLSLGSRRGKMNEEKHLVIGKKKRKEKEKTKAQREMRKARSCLEWAGTGLTI